MMAYSTGFSFFVPPFSPVQTLLCASVLVLLCVFVARCALRSHQWRSEQSLFTSALSVCPLNAKVNICGLCVFCLPPFYSMCQ